MSSLPGQAKQPRKSSSGYTYCTVYSVHSLLCGFFDKVFDRFIVSFRIYTSPPPPPPATISQYLRVFVSHLGILYEQEISPFCIIICVKKSAKRKVYSDAPPLSKIHENSKKKPHKNCSRSGNVTTGFEEKNQTKNHPLCHAFLQRMSLDSIRLHEELLKVPKCEIFDPFF